MSGNDFLGAFYEKPQKHYGFSWFRKAPGSPDLKIHWLAPARRAQTRTHFVRSIAPRVLGSPSITLVSVLSGIHYPPPPPRAQTRTHFIRSIAPRVLISPPITLVSVLSGIHCLGHSPEPRRELISFVLLHQGCCYHLQSRW